MNKINLVDHSQLDIGRLRELCRRPEPFVPGEPLFWNDPHISLQMLESHLQPDSDGASRKRETIERTVNWLHTLLPIPADAKVIDLGCGPGLYCTRMHQLGWNVTGMDYSQRSIAYAKQAAEQAGHDIRYIYQDYLTLDHQEQYDAALLIYYDIGVFDDQRRDQVIERTRLALKPGGYFVFDVVTAKGAQMVKQVGRRWQAADSGFWRPGPHLVLQETFHYPEVAAWVDQYVVVDQNGGTAVYRNWDHYYTPEAICPALERLGFEVVAIYGDLMGTPLDAQSAALGVVARRR